MTCMDVLKFSIDVKIKANINLFSNHKKTIQYFQRTEWFLCWYR